MRINFTTERDKHISGKEVMRSNWIIRIAQIMMILLLCNQIYSFVSEVISSVYHLNSANQGKFIPKVSILFLAIVVSLCFSLLWKVQKVSFISFVLGQIFIVVGVYDPLSFQRYVLVGLQMVGMILFLLGSGRMLFFLSTQRGLAFIGSVTFRRRTK
jgi:hypothetical protein